MVFKIGICAQNSINECILFLNSPAESFYDGEIEFTDKTYFGRFKGNLLSGMIDIERTIRGTFGSDFSLINCDKDMFKNMFPNVCESMFKKGKDFDIDKISYFLSSLRNINAHAVSGDYDKEFLKSDFSFLKEQKHFHKDIKYFNEDKVTIAGLIFIIFNFLRSNSISTICKEDFIFGLVSCGMFINDIGEDFVNSISNTNLEIDIRQEVGNNLRTAIFGELRKYVANDCLVIGTSNYPTFKANLKIDGKTLLMEKGSLTRIFYSENYYLEIVYEEGFIEFSNLLPPISFVDYLYALGIHKFDESTYKKMKEKISIVSKINKPKFYVDKNIYLLAFGDKASDFRIMSSLMVDALSRLFLTTEDLIYKMTNKNTNNKYTTIAKALSILKVPDNIVTEIKYLRNFSAHGYMLNDCIIYKNESRTFTLEYIVETISNLTSYLEKHHKIICDIFNKNKRDLLINKVIRAKYKIAVYYTKVVVENYPKYDKIELSKKNGYIRNSFFDICLFNKITEFEHQRLRVIEASIPFSEDHLYFFNEQSPENLFEKFCEKQGFTIKNKNDAGLLIYIELS